MNKKKFIPENLNRFLESFTDKLLNELEETSIIKTIDGQDGKRGYQLTSQSKESMGDSPVAIDKENPIVQEFYDFRNILLQVFQNLKFDDLENSQSNNLNVIVNKFIEVGAFDPTWKNVKALRGFMGQADNLLADPELKSEVITLLEKQKVNFNSLILQVLEFHTNYFLTKIFEGTQIENTILKKDSAADFIISFGESIPDLLVEVKLRKKKFSIKELIQQCIAALRKYDETKRNYSHVLLVLYTYGNLDELERNRYRFQQNMEENFEEYIENIHFTPVSINNFDKFPSDLSTVKDQLLGKQSIYFALKNQPIINGFPDKDDHYYEQVFDLNKCNYQIEFETKILVDHWRFGIKFSHSRAFPPRENRHGSNYPIFHFERNANQAGHLYYSYYAETGEQVLNEPSALFNYHGESIFIRIYIDDDVTIVDAFDINKASILNSPIKIGRFKYFKVFAWADNRNQFEFASSVSEEKENQYKLKFVIHSNIIPRLTEIESKIKELTGVVKIYQSQGETGRRYFEIERSFDSNREELVNAIRNILGYQ